MRTRFFCLLLFVLITNSSFGGEPVFEWQANLPFSDGSTMWDIIQASDDSFIGVGEIAMGSSGGTALTITAIDNYGTVLWDNTALSLGNSSAHSIVKFDGGFAVCGVCSDSLGSNGLIIKTDELGNIEWTVSSGYENDDAFYDLCITSDRNIIAVGYSYNEETSDNDVLVTSVSSAGEVLWRKRHTLPQYQTAYSIVPSLGSDSGFIITGSDDGNLFLTKLSSSGDWLWKTSHILDGYQVGQEVCNTSDGNYIVVGVTRPQVGFSDALLVFFDENGRVLRDYIWGADGPDNAYAIQELEPAGFVVLMNSNSGRGDGYRPLLIRFDPWLSVIWSVQLTATDALSYSFNFSDDGGFVISGQCNSPDHEGETSSSVLKYSSEDLFHWN